MSSFSRALGLKDGEYPFPWQEKLLAKFIEGIGSRTLLDIPTGLGKTSVMAAWLIARAEGADLPRRLVYIVDRRAVVDQATDQAEKLRSWIDNSPEIKSRLGLASDQKLPISTLRGKYADNRQWLEDPSAPAIVVGTVDMIGSRLLFEGYGVSRKVRPYHAALLGADTLFVLDEAHLVPPFEMMLQTLVSNRNDFGPSGNESHVIPGVKLLSLSATGRNVAGDVVRLTAEDLKHSNARKRLEASKRLSFRESDGSQPLYELLAEEAWELTERGGSNRRIIVFSNSREAAEKACEALRKLAKRDQKQGIEAELFVGSRRVRERERAAVWLKQQGFLAGSNGQLDHPSYVFATSAGEVGVDLDADHMVCDLVPWERMVQRLGRVNRRGNGDAAIRVVVEVQQPDRKTKEAIDKPAADRTKAEQKKVNAFESQNEQVNRYRLPISLLPQQGDWRNASPDAIRKLKLKADEDESLARILADATSVAPLHPALTRAVVDAWSMTSLEKHTGRPWVAPWLRGWVEDDSPQTTVIWRRWLPVCEQTQGTVKEQCAEVEKFFEEAPLHLSEMLETKSTHVFDWLTKRAKELLKATAQQLKVGETDKVLLKPDSVVGIFLRPDLDVVRMITLGELAFDTDNQKANTQRKEVLQRELNNNLLVLDMKFGGLSEKGLLDPLATYEHPFAGDDQEWSETGFRVRHSKDGAKSKDSDWQTVHRFVSRVSEEGEPEAWLLVEKQKQEAVSEDSRSIAPCLQELTIHQLFAEREADRLAGRLGLPADYTKMLRVAARLHDEGKRADNWQRAFNAPLGETKFAKAPGPVRFSLLGKYRHEFGSLPIVEADPEFQSLCPELQELALHLVAAHHGFARPIIRTDGCEDGPPSALEHRARNVALRFARLQRHWGPWGLAWWESLLRAADQRASREIETKPESNEMEAAHG